MLSYLVPQDGRTNLKDLEHLRTMAIAHIRKMEWTSLTTRRRCLIVFNFLHKTLCAYNVFILVFCYKTLFILK